MQIYILIHTDNVSSALKFFVARAPCCCALPGVPRQVGLYLAASGMARVILSIPAAMERLVDDRVIPDGCDCGLLRSSEKGESVGLEEHGVGFGQFVQDA